MSTNTASSDSECKLKYLASINSSVLGEDTDADSEVLYIDIGNVDSSGRVSEIASYRFEDAPSRARRLVQDGDVIISTVRTYLQAIAQIREPPDNLVVSTGFAVVRPLGDRFDARYCSFALRAPAFLAEVEKRSVGVSYPAINAKDLADAPIPVHPLPKQRVIADYLDRETARLDALIAAKQRLLELLAEKRRALITRAVTCGLDSNIPMRATDIHWLGEIPAHWEIWKLGHVASIGNGSTPNRNNAAYWSDGRIPWVNSGVVNQSEVTEAHQFVTARAVQECHLPLVEAGSVLVAITGQGKTRGGAVVLSIDSTINQHLAFVQPERSCLRPWFLRWMLFAAYDFLRGISDDGGGTKGALTCEQVSDIRVPIPPLEEQAAILDHISASTQRLDLLQSTAERTIAIIKERRAALIAAAVTGQIAVDAVGTRQ